MLRCAEWSIQVDRTVLELANTRCHWSAFEGSGPTRLELKRVQELPASVRLPLVGSRAPSGFFCLEGDVLRAQIPDDPLAAESVLRIAYHIASIRQGGLLAHGSGVAFGDHGLVAIASSGAGKSTLAALCLQRGARLLSDEVVLLFPDGRAEGTPFRSDLQAAGSPGWVRLRSLLLLEKGSTERIDTVSPALAVEPLLAQVFRPVVGEIGAGEAFRRLTAVISAAGVYRLTFRKDPAVGHFLKNWLAHGPG